MDPILSSAKVVMGEPEILEYVIKKYGHSSDTSYRTISFVNSESSVCWLREILQKYTEEYILIRTTIPNTIIGQESHYISLFIQQSHKCVHFLNSEHIVDRQMKVFIRKMSHTLSQMNYTFHDLTPNTAEEALQIHPRDTYCQSWCVFMLLYAFNHRRHKRLYPDFRHKSALQKMKFIQHWIRRVVVKTEGKFDFSLKYQVLTDFNYTINDKNINHLLKKIIKCEN